MLRIKKIDHVAICVEDLEGSLAQYKQLFDLEPPLQELVESQKTEAVLLAVGETSLELIAPRGNVGLAKFLEKRGPGLHHIAVEVEGIEGALAELKASGVPLIDESPRKGARGHKVAFLHPKATGGVLVELVEPEEHPVVSPLSTASRGGENDALFRQLFDPATSTYTYLLGDRSTGLAALIDPVLEHVERDLALVEDLGLKLAAVFDTHVHADHVTGAGRLRERSGARTHFSADGGPACADVLLRDGDRVSIGLLDVLSLATPGHTRSCMSYVVGNRVFTGDSLLIRGCGRTDFQQGSPEELWRSIHEKLFTLPDSMNVYPAHDYRGYTASTIAEEKEKNPRVGREATRESFVRLMNEMNLPPPAKIHEAVPANEACGRRP